MDCPAWVTPYVGLPYREGGRGPDAFDCWGLLLLVWRERFGLELPAYDDVTLSLRSNERTVAATITREASDRYVPVAPGQERCGDGMLMRVLGYPMHVGMVVAPGMMLHTTHASDACVERYDCLQWRHRVLGFYRHPDCHA